MPSFFRVLFEQVLGVLKELTTAQKITLTLLGVVIFISLAAIAFYGVKPDYTPLYANLSQQDAGEVVKKLAERNIPYKIGGDGTTILVPDRRVRELRVDLATEGLPKSSGFGYELFDQFKLGTTEFTQKVNYQRALETELSRTITSLSQIKAARVHIVIPEESLFVDEVAGGSASLVLDMVGNKRLSSDQINGLVYLVASSVKNLSPRNITVVDTNGNLLYSFTEEDGMEAGMSMRQIEVQRKYEKMVQVRIESMLYKVFGPNSAVVRVNIDMNFDTTKRESEIFVPAEDPIVRSERAIEEGFKGNNSPAPAGVNIPGQASAQNSNYTKLDETKNYEVSKRVEHYTKSPGAIMRMSIAVILDRQISDEERANLTQTISSAAGIDGNRGDILTLNTFTFDKTSMETDKAEMASAQRNQSIITIARNVGLGFLLLITFLYARRSIKRLSALSASGGSWGVDVTSGGAGGREVPKVAMEDEKELSPEDQKKVGMKNTLLEMVQTDPEVFSRLLRRWLSED